MIGQGSAQNINKFNKEKHLYKEKPTHADDSQNGCEE